MAFCPKFIGEVVKNTFYGSIWTLRQLIFLKKETIVFDHSRTLSVFFDPMLKHFRRSCEYYLLCVHRIIRMKKFFLKKLPFFNLFETLRKNISAFCRKFFGRFVKIAFYVSIGTFLRKNFNWTNLFLMKPSRTTTGKVWTSSKFFRRECQNSV